MTSSLTPLFCHTNSSAIAIPPTWHASPLSFDFSNPSQHPEQMPHIWAACHHPPGPPLVYRRALPHSVMSANAYQAPGATREVLCPMGGPERTRVGGGRKMKITWPPA